VRALARHGIFYGWAVVLVGFLTMFLVMGTRFSFGVFYSSMLAEMGWSRAATAGIFSVSMLVYAVVALGVGAAFDWWGPRRLFPVAAPHPCPCSPWSMLPGNRPECPLLSGSCRWRSCAHTSSGRRPMSPYQNW